MAVKMPAKICIDSGYRYRSAADFCFSAPAVDSQSMVRRQKDSIAQCSAIAQLFTLHLRHVVRK